MKKKSVNKKVSKKENKKYYTTLITILVVILSVAGFYFAGSYLEQNNLTGISLSPEERDDSKPIGLPTQLDCPISGMPHDKGDFINKYNGIIEKENWQLVECNGINNELKIGLLNGDCRVGAKEALLGNDANIEYVCPDVSAELDYCCSASCWIGRSGANRNNLEDAKVLKGLNCDDNTGNPEREAVVRELFEDNGININTNAVYNMDADPHTMNECRCKGTCVGGLKCETIFVILGLDGAVNDIEKKITVTGASEDCTASGEKVHTVGGIGPDNTHYSGRAIDLRSRPLSEGSRKIFQWHNGRSLPENFNYFLKFGFHKSSIEQWIEHGGTALHYHIVVNEEAIQEVLQCKVNRITETKPQ